MTLYGGITIGPIHETLKLARKTAEIWGASYLFSYIMKNVYESLDKKVFEIIVPFPSGSSTYMKKNVGLFHDRIIVKILDTNKNEKEIIDILTNTMDAKIDKLGKVIADALKIKDSINEVKQHLKKYIIYKVVCISCEVENEVIPRINRILDAQECFSTFITCENSGKNDYLVQFLEREKVKLSELITDAFSEKKIKIPSIPEIALRSLWNADRCNEKLNRLKIKPFHLKHRQKKRFYCNTVNDNGKENRLQRKQFRVKLWQKNSSLYNSDKSQGEPPIDKLDNEDFMAIFKQEEKKYFLKKGEYVAIVQSDGDNAGKIISDLSTAEAQEFSKKLFNFSLEALNKVKDFEAFPVYFGGDDMLFFAPVYSKKQKKSILSLVSELNNDFMETFKDYPLPKENPDKPGADNADCADKSKEHKDKMSLSFGVNIAYYKYPMKQMIENACDLLFSDAKNYEINDVIPASVGDPDVKPTELKTKKKNAIALKLIKHSGQVLTFMFCLKSQSWEKIVNFLNKTNESTLLVSIRTKIISNIKLIKNVLSGTDPATQLTNFFDNTFEKDFHYNNNNRLIIKDINDIMQTVYPELPDNRKDEFDTIIDGVLRYAKFLNEGV